jgi:hypothetical protein
LKNNTKEPNYTSFVTQYGISLSTVKKYYSILINVPTIPIIQAITIKKEKNSRSNLHLNSFQTSGSKINKNIKQEIKEVVEDFDTSDYSDTENQIFNRKTRRNSQVPSMPVKTYSFFKFTNTSDEDESKTIKCEGYNDECNFPSYLQNQSIVSNPFFRIKSKIAKNSSNLKRLEIKSKSFWIRNFGNDDAMTKKQKFIETFQKRNRKKIHTTNTDTDTTFSQSVPFIKCEEQNVKTENKINIHLKNPIRKKRPVKFISSSSSDLSIKSSNDSLSVNCKSLFKQTNVKASKLLTSDTSEMAESNFPKSFGSFSYQQEQSIKIEENVVNLNTNIVKNQIQNKNRKFQLI